MVNDLKSNKRKTKVTHETIVLNWSIRGAWGTEVRGYLGFRGRRRVLGRWKETEVRFLRCACEFVPARAAFFAALALAFWAEASVPNTQNLHTVSPNRKTYPWGRMSWPSESLRWPFCLQRDSGQNDFIRLRLNAEKACWGRLSLVCWETILV
jgi:hypothetical protein